MAAMRGQEPTIYPLGHPLNPTGSADETETDTKATSSRKTAGGDKDKTGDE